MLEPDSRVVLLDQLRPPSGCQLVSAVATTFTLALESALIPPLAFAAFEVRNNPDPLAILEAIRSTTDRVDLFCQAGQITVPRQAQDVMAFLEPMVHPVQAPRPGHLFHPKLWFVHYANPQGDDLFRLVCGSRNLVPSQAWDLAVTLEGRLTATTHDENESLAQLLEALPGMGVHPLAPHRTERVRTMAQLARRVEWQRPADVDALALHAWGIPGWEPTADFAGTSHLVISPFVNAAGLAHLAGPARTSRQRTLRLVSTQEALDALEITDLPADEPTHTHVLNPLAEYRDGLDGASHDQATGEAAAEDPPVGETQPHAPGHTERIGLHAKVTVVEYNRRARAFIGSPNATDAAYGGNVEFAVELRGSSSRLGIGAILATADGQFGSVLEPYARQQEAAISVDDELSDAKRALRRLAAIPFTLTVDGPAGEHRLTLTSDKALDQITAARAHLLTQPATWRELTPGSPANVQFTPVPVADVTPFVVLTLPLPGDKQLATVVHARLVNDPPNRLDEVLARQLDSREKFMRFLQLVLALADGSTLWAPLTDAAALGGTTGWGATGSGAGMLESLVQALATDPSKLRSLQSVVTKLDERDRQALSADPTAIPVLPHGFTALWQAVLEASEQIEARR